MKQHQQIIIIINVINLTTYIYINTHPFIHEIYTCVCHTSLTQAAAAAKNFKEAASLSKEVKTTESRGEECRNEAAELATSVEALEQSRTELHKVALDARAKLVSAEKEFDLKKLNALRELAVELRHAELIAEAKLAQSVKILQEEVEEQYDSSSVRRRNCLSYGALVMARSEVKIIMKDVALLTERSGVHDDWKLPDKLPREKQSEPVEVAEVQDVGEKEKEEVVAEAAATSEVEAPCVVADAEEEEEVPMVVNDGEGAVEASLDSDEAVDTKSVGDDELEQALRNLSGSFVNEEDNENKDVSVALVGEEATGLFGDNQEESEEGGKDGGDQNDETVAHNENEEENIVNHEENDEAAAAKAEAARREEEERLALEKQRLEAEEAERLALELESLKSEYFQHAKSIFKDIEELDAKILTAADEEDFELADELQQQLESKEEELKVFSEIDEVHAEAVTQAKF
jgi:hypothetical protein